MAPSVPFIATHLLPATLTGAQEVELATLAVDMYADPPASLDPEVDSSRKYAIGFEAWMA